MVAASEARETRDAHPNWIQTLTRLASRASLGSAWAFQIGVAITVALTVATMLVWLDGSSWPVAIGAGAIALLPALVAGGAALHLARALAQSSVQRELLMVDD
jgi:hypothetical protein